MDSVPETIETAPPSVGFDEAFMLHHRAVYRAAYALVRDAGLAEDVTQEVFLKLYHHLDSLKGEEHLRPWLLRVASNVALNTIRGRSRAVAREDEFARGVVGTDWRTAPLEADYERFPHRAERVSRLALRSGNAA